MKMQFPEGLSHFYNSLGHEFKPDANGQATTDHSDTIAEMIKSGFVAVEEEVKAVVEEVVGWITHLIHHETGDTISQLPTPVKVGDTVGVEVNGEIVEHEVLQVSTDTKTAVVRPKGEDDNTGVLDTSGLTPVSTPLTNDMPTQGDDFSDEDTTRSEDNGSAKEKDKPSHDDKKD